LIGEYSVHNNLNTRQDAPEHEGIRLACRRRSCILTSSRWRDVLQRGSPTPTSLASVAVTLNRRERNAHAFALSPVMVTVGKLEVGYCFRGFGTQFSSAPCVKRPDLLPGLFLFGPGLPLPRADSIIDAAVRMTLLLQDLLEQHDGSGLAVRVRLRHQPDAGGFHFRFDLRDAGADQLAVLLFGDEEFPC
jgi:hypothetical protein